MNPFQDLANTEYGRMEAIWSRLLAQYQANLGHLVAVSLGGNLSLGQYCPTQHPNKDPESNESF